MSKCKECGAQTDGFGYCASCGHDEDESPTSGLEFEPEEEESEED